MRWPEALKPPGVASEVMFPYGVFEKVHRELDAMYASTSDVEMGSAGSSGARTSKKQVASAQVV